MEDRNDPILHLLHGMEEILTAAALGLQDWRERRSRRAARQQEGDPADGSSAGADPPGWEAALDLDGLRAALREERARWEARAPHDRAAQRVRDLLGALLEVIGEKPRGRSRERRAPRRSAARGPREAGRN